MKKISMLFMLAVLVALFPGKGGAAVTIDPASGTTLNSISSIDVYFGYWVDKLDTQKVYITNAADEKFPCTGFSMNYGTYYMQGGTLSFAKISAPGTYTLVVEAGAATPWFSTDSPNDLIEATYIVDSSMAELTYLSNMVLTPASGQTLPNINGISISLPKIGYYDPIVANDDVWRHAVLTSGSKTYYCVELTGYSGSWKMNFSDKSGGTTADAVKITEPGKYTLSIPAGIFNNGVDIAEDPDTYFESPALTAEYTVSDDIEFTYTADPADGSVKVIPNFGYINLSFAFADASDISLEPKTEGASLKVFINGVEVDRVEDLYEATGYQLSAYTGSLSVRISRELITEDSLIEVVADKGAFTIEGLASPAISYSVTYNLPKVYTYYFYPAPDVPAKSLKTIVITFDNADYVEKSYFCYNNDAWLSTMRDTYYSKTLEVDNSGEHPTLTVTFGDDVPDGSYTFTLRDQSLMLDGEYSKTITASFVQDSNATTGVATVSSAAAAISAGHNSIAVSNPSNADVAVFTLDGKLVLSGNGAELAADVLPGVYVVRIGNDTSKVIVK